ncbi:MAG: hypothetical protein AAFW64_05550 [Pseudomonadota bacterium]
MSVDADLLMFLGVLLVAGMFPIMVGSFSRGDSPRTAIVFGFIGGSLIVAAIAMTPGGYEFDEIPGLMVRVVRDAFN